MLRRVLYTGFVQTPSGDSIEIQGDCDSCQTPAMPIFRPPFPQKHKPSFWTGAIAK